MCFFNTLTYSSQPRKLLLSELLGSNAARSACDRKFDLTQLWSELFGGRSWLIEASKQLRTVLSREEKKSKTSAKNLTTSIFASNCSLEWRILPGSIKSTPFCTSPIAKFQLFSKAQTRWKFSSGCLHDFCQKEQNVAICAAMFAVTFGDGIQCWLF